MIESAYYIIKDASTLHVLWAELLLLSPRYLQKDSEIDIFYVLLLEQDYKKEAGIQNCYANAF